MIEIAVKTDNISLYSYCEDRVDLFKKLRSLRDAYLDYKVEINEYDEEDYENRELIYKGILEEAIEWFR